MRFVEVVRGLGLGGMETLLYQRLKYSIEAKLIDPEDTLVINTYPGQDYFLDKIVALGVSVLASRSDNRIRSSIYLLKSIQRMHSDQMIVVHSPFPAAIIKAREAVWRRPVPVVQVSHNTQSARATLALGRVLNRCAYMCIAVSDDVARAQTTVGFPRKTVILAGVDRSAMRRWVETDSGAVHQMRASLGVVGDARLVVAVGRLSELKGHRHLLSAINEIGDSRVHVAIIGVGDQRAALEHQVRSLGLDDRVHLLGRQDDAWRWTAAGDLLAHPSYSEGLPVAVIEARVLGVPVVASNVGGVAQVLTGSRTSRLVEAGSNSALAKAIRQVLDNAKPFSEVFQDRAIEETSWDISRYSRDFYRVLSEVPNRGQPSVEI